MPEIKEVLQPPNLLQAWQAHATSYVCAPWGAGSSGVLLESAHDSMPHGIPAANFVTLMMALTDAPDWQAWQLSDCLDEHCTGLLGCAQFALAVTLLCAGLSGRQAAAMYAYAPHIARVFTGVELPHTASCYSQVVVAVVLKSDTLHPLCRA
jgi:hypothetical protein